MTKSWKSVLSHCAAASTGIAIAVGADFPSLAQAIAPATVNPQAVPAVESAPLPVTVERATGVAVAWSIVNRFRLFRDERDGQFSGSACSAG